MKVWLISSFHQEFVEGPITDTIEVVEKAEYDRLRGALQSIAGKRRPSGKYCQDVAYAALAKEALDG